MNRIANGKLTLERSLTDLHGIVQDAVAIMDHHLRAKRLSVRAALEARVASVYGDEKRLRQVFWNLLSNAIKFTAPGGEVRIVSANPDSSHISVAVSDTGVGVAPEHLAQVFEPFEQVNRGDAAIGGLGLGLSISKAVVQAHDGSIRAYSSGEGQGTAFEVVLQLSQPE
jgi:signal transduction histidine kinase